MYFFTVSMYLRPWIQKCLLAWSLRTSLIECTWEWIWVFSLLEVRIATYSKYWLVLRVSLLSANMIWILLGWPFCVRGRFISEMQPSPDPKVLRTYTQQWQEGPQVVLWIYCLPNCCHQFQWGWSLRDYHVFADPAFRSLTVKLTIFLMTFFWIHASWILIWIFIFLSCFWQYWKEATEELTYWWGTDLLEAGLKLEGMLVTQENPTYLFNFSSKCKRNSPNLTSLLNT